ncbi:hypothetical protein DIPPA_02937 [Diplonema papillatum]|nr:hypothetical protein DIPPA_02937 [Diplonema papillatum]
MSQQSGKVFKWLADRGYGFIDPVGGDVSKTVFLHHSELVDEVEPFIGDTVWYDVRYDPKTNRPRATHVVLDMTAHKNNKQAQGHRGNRWDDSAISSRDDEQILIEFGKLLDGGDAGATKVHKQYMETNDYDQFVSKARKMLRQKGGRKGGDEPEQGHREYGNRYHDSASDARADEQILIEFGKLLEEGDEAAVKVHSQYMEANNYDLFVTRARKVLKQKEKKGPADEVAEVAVDSGFPSGGGGGGKGKKKEERLLISFGLKLQNGDAGAQKIHKEYVDNNDYKKFISAVEELLG